MMRGIGFALTALLAIGGCSSISVTSDYDPAIDFSTLKTYQWIETKMASSTGASMELVQKRIVAAADQVLASKGFRLATAGEPDMLVATYLGVQDKINVTDWGYSYGGWWGPYGPYGRNVDVSYYKEGTLFIDVVRNNPEKDELIWRGAGTGVIRETTTPEEREERIREVVGLILEDFPPQK